MRLVMVMVGSVLLLGVPASAAARNQVEVALQVEDLPPQYETVAMERPDVGVQFEAQRTVYAKRSATEPGPMAISSYVVISPVGEMANGAQSARRFRQAPHQEAISLVLTSLESDPSLARSEVAGPAIGEDTQWFRADGISDHGAGTVHSVVFSAGDGAALLEMWSSDRTADGSALLPLAGVVAGRLRAAGPLRTPFAPENRNLGDGDL
jgi:hypothetical protein